MQDKIIKLIAVESLGGYVVVNILTIAVLIYFYNINWTLFEYPIKYNGDALDILRRMKMVINGDWPINGIAQSSKIGLPFGFNLGDFPTPNFSFLFLIKILSIFIKDHFVMFNTLIIVSYLATSNAMFFILKRLSINAYTSIVISILFSFLPFHIFRIGHFSYILYFYLPILIYLILKLWDDTPLFYKEKEGKYILSLSLKNVIILGGIAFFALINLYITFFISFLVLVAGISAYIDKKSTKHILSATIFLLLLVVPFIINMVPYKLYEFDYGVNSSIAQRTIAESEIYGLKIAQLILPVNNHRVEFLSEIKRKTNKNPLINENSMATLGIGASIGFMFLLFSIFKNRSKHNDISKLAILNLYAVLFATIGGFSSVFATLITPQIRGHNRISIVIATMSLIAAAILINYVLKNKSKKTVVVVSIAILSIGLLDQITPKMSLKPSEKIMEKFTSDKQFIAQIEGLFVQEQSAKILQLPYMSFPEHPPINKMNDYAQMVNYLHSNTLSWSYGAIRGRKSDVWLSQLTVLPIEKMINIIQNRGFNGVLINRLGYEDHGKEIERRLEELIKKKPIESYDKSQSFFQLLSPIHDMQMMLPLIENKNSVDIYKPNDFFGSMIKIYSGVYRVETDTNGIWWQWAFSDVNIEVYSKTKRRGKMHITLRVASPRTLEIVVGNASISKHEFVDLLDKEIIVDINLVKGNNDITLKSDKNPIRLSDSDSRVFSFLISDIYIE